MFDESILKWIKDSSIEKDCDRHGHRHPHDSVEMKRLQYNGKGHQAWVHHGMMQLEETLNGVDYIFCEQSEVGPLHYSTWARQKYRSARLPKVTLNQEYALWKLRILEFSCSVVWIKEFDYKFYTNPELNNKQRQKIIYQKYAEHAGIFERGDPSVLGIQHLMNCKDRCQHSMLGMICVKMTPWEWMIETKSHFLMRCDTCCVC